MAPSAPASRSNDETRRLWRLAGLGATLASEIVAGLLIGWVLDKWLDTAPVCMVIGTVVGVLVGMTSFLRIALRESRQAGRRAAELLQDDDDRASGGSGRPANTPDDLDQADDHP